MRFLMLRILFATLTPESPSSQTSEPLPIILQASYCQPFYHYDPVHCAAPQKQPLLESINEAPEVLEEDLDSMEPVDFDVGD